MSLRYLIKYGQGDEINCDLSTFIEGVEVEGDALQKTIDQYHL